MAKVALLIGISEYEPGLNPLPAAVKDIEALWRVLQDPEMGGFDEVKMLANPEPHEMQLEIETLFADRTKDDLVLLFFSGHGIKDDAGRLYFASRSTRKSRKGDLVRATAVPTSFVHDMMSNSRAKRQAVILDCCFSGAFDPSLQAKDDGSFDLQGQLGAEGRVVLASSSSTQYSFEQKGSDLSIYTQYLVEGIETGAADQDQDGQVSILELHEYATRKVQEEVPNVTPKIIVLRDKGFEIILAKTKTKANKLPNINNKRIDLGEIKLEPNEKSESLAYYNAIPSLLQSLNPLIERLVEQFKNHYLSRSRSSNSLSTANIDSILELIRLASDADFIFLMNSSQNQNRWKLESQSTLKEEIDESNYANIIRTKILSSISTESIFTTGHHGIYRIFHDEKTETSKAFILIPLDSSNDSEFMVICGLSKDSHYLNDAYTRIVASFYKATRNSHLNPSRVEANVLDDLKRAYDFLPISFYNRRFDLFCDRLSQTVIYFEPILDLRKIAITSWEALARDPESLSTPGDLRDSESLSAPGDLRDPESLSAPGDLFDAAELWGRKFTTQLDVELLKLAANTYHRANSEIKRNRPDDMDPLSVNVYPESLLETVYFETVRQITTPDEEGNTLLPADSLVLEISEKRDLPMYNNGVRLKSPMKAFEEKLRQYTQELEIKFAIDDFGVGHASVSRLAGLKPPHVKIDRDILHQQQADVIIRFVREIVAKYSGLHITEVTVEGMDDESPITLHQLKQLGIYRVQGYIIGKAQPRIYRLTPEKYEFLRKLIQQ
jgi:EAL domain-containing protein (putative c-di-GMP-specific phosphodiesterase class I)